MKWIWDKLRVALAMLILFVALFFATISVIFHWIAEAIEKLANRVA